MHTQQPSPRIKFDQAFPQTRISFTRFEHMPYVKHHLSRSLPHHFVRLPLTQLSLNLALIPLVEKSYRPFSYPHWYDIVNFYRTPNNMLGLFFKFCFLDLLCFSQSLSYTTLALKNNSTFLAFFLISIWLFNSNTYYDIF